MDWEPKRLQEKVLTAKARLTFIIKLVYHRLMVGTPKINLKVQLLNANIFDTSQAHESFAKLIRKLSKEENFSKHLVFIIAVIVDLYSYLLMSLCMCKWLSTN